MVKLVTIDPADEIYTWWGHSALIVEDTRLRIGRFYNYGLFSFEQENFIVNFAMGRLWFEVGGTQADRELAYYRGRNRSLRLQTLDLSPAKRLEMAQFLEWNILPENRAYLYDHYRDNCATRVRDLINRTVGGQLAAATTAPGRMSLRRHTRRFTAGHFFMNWLLMFLMSGVVDRPITKWDEMFLPVELEKNVARLAYLDPEGRRKPLVSESALYFQARGRPEVLERPPALWAPALGLSLGLALVVLALGWWVRRGSASLGRVIFGLYNGLLGLLFGLPGSALFFMSLFTDHTVTYANRNLFLANPLTLAALPLGIALAAGGKRAGKWLALLWAMLAALAVVSLVLQLFPGIRQDNWLAAATLLPVLIGCAGSSLMTARRGWIRFRKREQRARIARLQDGNRP